MEKRRVVITGMGAITPIGNNIKEMWEGVVEGRCGIDSITLVDVSGLAVKLAGEVKGVNVDELVDKKEGRKMDRYTKLAMIAAEEAFKDSGLDMGQEDAGRCGVIISSGIGGLETIEKDTIKGEQKGYKFVSPYFIPMSISNMAAGNVAIKYGFKGMCSCVATACASGSNAIGDSFRQIRDGYLDVMMCGGAEASITKVGLAGFVSMKALCISGDKDRASIPFDKERSGFVMGEGAGVLVLEEYEHALKRGAKIYGEVAGYGATCDAHHITAPAPDGEGAARCMSLALKDAGVAAEEIGYINAHGTSTHMNDQCETAAIKTVFGKDTKVAVSSTKSMTGHLLGASGAVEAIITALAIKNSYIPATIHYQVPDEECDLDIVPNKGREKKLTYAMSNSLGFGGHNASLVFKAY